MSSPICRKPSTEVTTNSAKVLGMTRTGIDPGSTALENDTLPIVLSGPLRLRGTSSVL